MACKRYRVVTIDSKGYRTLDSEHKTQPKALKKFSSLFFPDGGSVEVYDPEGDLITSKSWPSRSMTVSFLSQD